MTPPLVSVIVPTYRRADYLRETLDSVFSQTCTDLEVILVEDGSGQAAGALGKHAGRVEYIWQPNQGVGVARNTGAARARGRWLAFLDDDDLWAPEKLERQLAFAARHPETGLWHTDHLVLVDGHLRVPRRAPGQAVPSGWVSAALVLSNFIVASSVLVRKAEFEGVGGFTADRDCAEDLELWLRLSRVCPIGFVPEPLTIYRDHSRSMSSELRWRFCHVNALEQIIRRYPEIWQEVGPAALRRHVSGVYWTGGYDHLMHEQYAGATRLFLGAWRWRPWNARSLVYATACATGAVGISVARQLKGALSRPARSAR